MVIVEDYTNSPLPSRAGSSKDYSNIIKSFHDVRRYNIAFAINNSNKTESDCDERKICIAHLTTNNSDINNKNANNKHSFKTKWTIDDISDFNEHIKHQLIDIDNESQYNYNYDSLVYILSSYGNKNKEIFDSNGETLSLELIYNEFNNVQCKNLRHKPKIYLFDIDRAMNNRNAGDTRDKKLTHISAKKETMTGEMESLQLNDDDEKKSLKMPSNKGHEMHNRQLQHKTYMKESNCRKIFGNSHQQQQQAMLKLTKNDNFYSIFIEGLNRVVCNDKILLNHNFGDLIFEIRKEMALLLNLNKNEIDSVMLNDYSTMPYDIQFVKCQTNVAMQLNSCENQKVMEQTVCFILLEFLAFFT